ARPADGAVRAVVRVRGRARFGTAAPAAARRSTLWSDDPRLGRRSHRRPTREVDGHVDDAGLGPDPAGTDAAARRLSLVGAGAAGRLHGGGGDLALVAAGASGASRSRRWLIAMVPAGRRDSSCPAGRAT